MKTNEAWSDLEPIALRLKRKLIYDTILHSKPTEQIR